ncbi:MAG: glycosyltransferase family 9 protein [Phycisphaerae bacterium]
MKSLGVPQHILVIMPTWLGDAVMATPFLRALRDLYPFGRITCLGKPLVQPVLSGLSLIDEAMEYRLTPAGKIDTAGSIAALRQQNFDLAIILPNSLRAAILAWRAGIPRRLGYNRDGRKLLLTDSINPVPREERQIRLQLQRHTVRKLIRTGHWPDMGAILPKVEQFAAWRVKLAGWKNFQPLPTIDYYLALSRYLGSSQTDRRMVLGITDGERVEAMAALAQTGLTMESPYMLLFPGANFGASKCWLPERFATVAAAVVASRRSQDAAVLIGGAVTEQPLIDAIMANLPNSTATRIIPLYKLNGGSGVRLGAVKELVRRARLVLCNDTGPRHFAAALGSPLVTLFGPTDPRWAEIFYNQEQLLAVGVPCGPCQLKICPIDHRCMIGITPEMVLQAVDRFWPKDAA